MSRPYLILISVALTGCAGQAQPEDIVTAEQQCARHGGYASVARYEHGRNVQINCKDGTYIDLRRGETKQ